GTADPAEIDAAQIERRCVERGGPRCERVRRGLAERGPEAEVAGHRRSGLAKAAEIHRPGRLLRLRQVPGLFLLGRAPGLRLERGRYGRSLDALLQLRDDLAHVAGRRILLQQLAV